MSLRGRLQQSAVNFSQLELLAQYQLHIPHLTFKCTFEQAEERISELEDTTMEIKSEEQKENRSKQRLRGLWDKINQTKIREKGGRENI